MPYCVSQWCKSTVFNHYWLINSQLCHLCDACLFSRVNPQLEHVVFPPRIPCVIRTRDFLATVAYANKNTCKLTPDMCWWGNSRLKPLQSYRERSCTYCKERALEFSWQQYSFGLIPRPHQGGMANLNHCHFPLFVSVHSWCFVCGRRVLIHHLCTYCSTSVGLDLWK